MDLHYEGGAPLIGDSPALDLANTFYAVRGNRREGLSTPRDLAAWAPLLAPQLKIELSSAQLSKARADEFALILDLRSAIRDIATALTGGKELKGTPIEVLNRAASSAPLYQVLMLGQDGSLATSYRSRSGAVQTLLSALAVDAIDLFSGERRHLLRDCTAPGCFLFFLKDHPRREWCTPACGTRVRAARAYYKKTHRQPADRILK